MKTQNLILAGLAAGAVYLVFRMTAGSNAAPGGKAQTTKSAASSIYSLNPNPTSDIGLKAPQASAGGITGLVDQINAAVLPATANDVAGFYSLSAAAPALNAVPVSDINSGIMGAFA
jgi:hypothetical protein